MKEADYLLGVPDIQCLAGRAANENFFSLCFPLSYPAIAM